MNTDNLNLPWRVEGDSFPAIWDSSNDLIIEYDTKYSIDPCSKEVHNYIVEAVNSHTSLVERVKELEEEYKKLFKAYYSEQSRQEFIKECDLLQRVRELEQSLENITDYFEHEMDYPSDNSYIEQARKALQKKEKEV